MYLKSLTLRGFKSFASATTLRFEPGITAVVGPNGSGKSNVVDALAWVMGEQGAKTLRGARMEDVIFAGAGRSGDSAGRSALGRAEVVLTIDNADGALPIEYTEVSITRTMFRSGGSDYAINGTGCRLLDIQELLSDSGIGHEMHVIVGQGRLDTVLAAGPEERRAFVEEAAGVLKHRRRKEKALRKLDAMAANLDRVADLTAELRRQLKPLGRQAETARRAQAIAAELRAVRGRLLAVDVLAVSAVLDSLAAAQGVAERDRDALVARVAAVRADRDRLEALTVGVNDRIGAAQQEWFAASGLLERVGATLAVARERAQARGSGGGAADVVTAPDPAALRAEAARLRAVEAACRADLEAATAATGAAAATRAAAQARLAHAEQQRRDVARTQARLRDRVATLAAELAAVRSRRAARLAEIDRAGTARAEALDRAARAEHDFTAREHGVAGLDAGEGDLDAEHERAEAAHAGARAELEHLRERSRAVDTERAALVARRDGLRLGLDARDAAAQLLASGAATGTVAAALAVAPGWETAVAVVLDRWADAVVVDGPDGARAALDALAGADWGAAGLLVSGPLVSGSGAAAARPPGASAHPIGTAVALAALVAVRPGAPDIGDALRALVDGVVAVADLDEAAATVEAGHRRGVELTAVTRTGQLLGAGRAAGGRTGRSRVELAAAVDDAELRLQTLAHDGQRLRFDLAAATEAEQEAAALAAGALDRLHESDARLAAVAEELGHLGQRARAARGEAERVQGALDAAERALAADDDDVRTREQRLEAARAEAVTVAGTLFDPGSTDGPETPGTPDLSGTAADEHLAAGGLEAARAAEVDARLAQRSAEERLAAVEGRAGGLDRRAADAEVAAARALAEVRRRQARTVRAAAVAGAAGWLAEVVGAQVAVAGARAADARQLATATVGQLHAVRAALTAAEAELAVAVDVSHAAQLAIAGHRAEVDRLTALAAEQLSVTPEQLVAEFGPGAEPGAEAGAEAGSDTLAELPSERGALEALRRRAERALAELGRVNPLALEEFDALGQRLAFLTEQLLDLRRSRDDLLGVVAEVDARVRDVFASAFADTATAFAGVFGRLFPGGQGRLYLTDPDEPLTSGIEVEARPAGKKVARLSLLSGGERSLVAVALLVAIFKARPSPFYVLDEVEAALDDTNLGRLLSIYEELRETSQLLVVTHQKRTMEIADALYGVSMRGDGVSTVISQRVRTREAVGA